MAAAEAVDVHQHLWPEQLVDRLRARTRAPYLRGWTLYTRGEPAYEVDPAHHDVQRASRRTSEDGVGLACVSLSAPLGIENLVRPEAGALLAAWHEGARELPGHFRAWASVPMVDPDLDELAGPAARRLRRRAGAGHRPALAGRLGARGCRCSGSPRRPGKPVFVHPGPELAAPLAGRAAGVVGAGRRLRHPDAGGLVGLAGGRRARAVPVAAGAVRRRRRAGAGAPRAPRRPRRRAADDRPGRLRRHLVVRPPGARRAGPGARASTCSRSAATGPTPRRSTGCSATPPPTPSGSPTRDGCSTDRDVSQHQERVEGRTWPRAS